MNSTVWVKAASNIISMVSIPFGTVNLQGTTTPFGILLIALGAMLQVVKYMLDEQAQMPQLPVQQNVSTHN